MLDYKFLLNNITDITDRITTFSYSENINDFTSSFSFDYIPFQTNNIEMTTTNGGNEYVNRIFVKSNGQTVYQGIITDVEHTTDENKFAYSGFDVGFYLNKNQVIKQFKNTNIGVAIEQLCRDYGINVPSMPIFTKTVTKNYKGEVFADIVKELLQLEKDKGGISDIYVDCKTGGFNINQYTSNNNLSSLIANQILINSFETIDNVKVTHSIRELKNKVVYVDNSEKSWKEVTKDNPSSINTYGLLKYVETVDTSKTNNLEQIAQNKLDELNVIKDTISLSMLGDFNVKKGVIIPLNINQYNLQGTYLITSATHTLTSDKEVVSVEVEKYDIT